MSEISLSTYDDAAPSHDCRLEKEETCRICPHVEVCNNSTPLSLFLEASLDELSSFDSRARRRKYRTRGKNVSTRKRRSVLAPRGPEHCGNQAPQFCKHCSEKSLCYPKRRWVDHDGFTREQEAGQLGESRIVHCQYEGKVACAHCSQNILGKRCYSDTAIVLRFNREKNEMTDAETLKHYEEVSRKLARFGLYLESVVGSALLVKYQAESNDERDSDVVTSFYSLAEVDEFLKSITVLARVFRVEPRRQRSSDEHCQ